MYSFEGQHRSKPTVSLRGNSRQEKKSELLFRVHSDRHDRELRKRQQNAAVVIQSHYRSYVCRRLLFEEISLNYAAQASQLGRTDVTLLHTVTRQLLFMCTVKLEVDKVVTLCQHWLQMKYAIVSRTLDKSTCTWFVQLRRLLAICCRILQDNMCGSVAIPLRMIEVFTDPKIVTEESIKCAILEHLSKHGVFTSLVSVLERSVPVPDGDTTHRSPLATSLLQIISALITHNKEFMLQSFVATVMARSLTAHMIHFIIPAVKEDVPISSVISAIMETNQNAHTLDTLYCLLCNVEGRIVAMEPLEVIRLVDAIALLLEGCGQDVMTSSDDDEPLYQPDMLYRLCDPLESREELHTCCLRKVSSMELATAIMKIIDHGDGIKPISRLCYQLLRQSYSYHNSCIFQLLSLQPVILKHVWTSITSMQTAGIFSSTKVLQQLAGGVVISPISSHDLIPQLVTFCSLFQLTLFTLHDAEFYVDMIVKTPLPFTLSEICRLSGVLRDVMINIAMDKHVPNSMTHKSTTLDTVTSPSPAEWNCLLTHLRRLLRLLHERDSRRPFCPKNHWVSSVLRHKLLQLPASIFEEEDGNLSHLLSQSVIKTRDLLKQTPFVFSFTERVKLFWQLVEDNKAEIQGPSRHFGGGISFTVRRDQLYSDAFSQLASPDTDIKKKLRVTMVNALQLEEAGYGEGVLREFLNELIKESFDPNRGLFCRTDQQELFPNPQARMIMDDYKLHYYFIGRLLGKTLYENLLVELPLASFFLCKMISGGNVDIHYLASLDPQLYRNLLSLKQTSVTDLGLTFSITNNDMGEGQTVDLKLGGSFIPVTDDNKVEYIHLVANYRLNRQLSLQCASFREGLSSVIPQEWLQLFSHHELQVLISGADVAIDVNDLRAHTQYAGGYGDEHECIELFWKVVGTMTDEQKRLLLKFVTSCSRPPLLGFKDLFPPFGIQCVSGEEGRLPTASTCMNLLKLPDIRDLTQMKEKLLYAVNSGAGFELS
ncbi:ubiquitin-protein ligase E3C-like isoform X2 [Dysidea avara]|uniref:ubiquitin-protein ligase E3C-like isoform X2 n=1 Tax=Dysidea avara TaxID=196820 RepID=UPI003331493E